MKTYPCFGFTWVVVLFALSKCASLPITSNEIPLLNYITLEEHYDSESMKPYETNRIYMLLIDAVGNIITSLLEDITGARLSSMNKNGIWIQVVSNSPNPEALERPEVVRDANNELAKAISSNSDRFRGFCFLPMAYPQLAADELVRCVSQLGFAGALVDDHLANGTFYDGPEYDVLWDAFERLDPRTDEVNKTGGLYTPYDGDYSFITASVLAAAGWGWHSDCGMQFLRLWLAGVFDSHPDLEIVLGHMGEMLPYMLIRINDTLGPAKTTGATILETYAKNVWVTTSGFFSLDPFLTLLGTTDIKRVLFSVDWPWSTNEDGTKFMEALRTSGLVDYEERESIAFQNAKELIKLELTCYVCLRGD